MIRCVPCIVPDPWLGVGNISHAAVLFLLALNLKGNGKSDDF